MEQQEFRRLLELFPVVRPRDYHVDLDPSRQSTSQSGQSKVVKEKQIDLGERDRNRGANLHDAFWKKLRSVAERKVGAEDAEKFYKAFRHIHEKLVYEGLSSDAAQKLLQASKSNEE